MKDTIKYLVWIFAIVPFLIACGDSNTDDAPTDDFDVRFELPATVDVAKGGELTFTVKEGKSPLTTDSFLLEGGGPLSRRVRIRFLHSLPQTGRTQEIDRQNLHQHRRQDRL